jgi:hypothetical protein
MKNPTRRERPSRSDGENRRGWRCHNPVPIPYHTDPTRRARARGTNRREASNRGPGPLTDRPLAQRNPDPICTRPRASGCARPWPPARLRSPLTRTRPPSRTPPTIAACLIRTGRGQCSSTIRSTVGRREIIPCSALSPCRTRGIVPCRRGGRSRIAGTDSKAG